jgi:hypothetical protein
MAYYREIIRQCYPEESVAYAAQWVEPVILRLKFESTKPILLFTSADFVAEFGGGKKR